MHLIVAQHLLDIPSRVLNWYLPCSAMLAETVHSVVDTFNQVRCARALQEIVHGWHAFA